MALTLLIMLTTTHFEDLDFIVATLSYYGSKHLCTLDQRRTEFHGIACAHCEFRKAGGKIEVLGTTWALKKAS